MRKGVPRHNMGARVCAPLCFSQLQLFWLAPLERLAQRLREHRRECPGVNLEADADVGPGGVPVGHRLALRQLAVGFGLHGGGTGGELAGFDGAAVGGYIVRPAAFWRGAREPYGADPSEDGLAGRRDRPQCDGQRSPVYSSTLRALTGKLRWTLSLVSASLP